MAPDICCVQGFGGNPQNSCTSASSCNGDIYNCAGSANCPGGVCCIQVGGATDVATCHNGTRCPQGTSVVQACQPGDTCPSGTTCNTMCSTANMPCCE
jgi:hypothetical protein